jgi:bifunctional non-homologous end joining protein LigD
MDGRDVRLVPLLERKRLLGQLSVAGARIELVAPIQAHGEALFATACELGVEGIVAKRADSLYRAGRQGTWLKIKNPGYCRREAIEGLQHRYQSRG